MKVLTNFTWKNDPTVSLTLYKNEEKGNNKKAILVLPGGGYNTCSPFEGEPIAKRFNEEGFVSFVLNYSTKYQSFDDMVNNANVNEHTLFPEPLKEVSAAFKYIYDNAELFDIDKNKICIIGFSAGGHLASCYSSMYFYKEICGEIKNPNILKPACCILGYAASEMHENEMVLPTIFGKLDSYPFELRKQYSAKYHVSEKTSPTFIFHSVTDPLVPVQESIDMANALNKVNVPYELHLFGLGGHAYGLADKNKVYSKWFELSISFINGIIDEIEQYSKEKVLEEMERVFKKRREEERKQQYENDY